MIETVTQSSLSSVYPVTRSTCKYTWVNVLPRVASLMTGRTFLYTTQPLQASAVSVHFTFVTCSTSYPVPSIFQSLSLLIKKFAFSNRVHSDKTNHSRFFYDFWKALIEVLYLCNIYLIMSLSFFEDWIKWRGTAFWKAYI